MDKEDEGESESEGKNERKKRRNNAKKVNHTRFIVEVPVVVHLLLEVIIVAVRREEVQKQKLTFSLVCPHLFFYNMRPF